MRTKEALTLRKANGMVLGRRKGSYTKLNVLIDNKQKIIQMLDQGVSITQICKRYALSRDTFDKFKRRFPSVQQAVNGKRYRFKKQNPF